MAFDRELVIQELIQSDTVQLFQIDGKQTKSNYSVNECVRLIQSYLRDGFIGYDNMDDEELIKECEDRDISYLFGPNDD